MPDAIASSPFSSSATAEKSQRARQIVSTLVSAGVTLTQVGRAIVVLYGDRSAESYSNTNRPLLLAFAIDGGREREQVEARPLAHARGYE